jgi:hypothetical protein
MFSTNFIFCWPYNEKQDEAEIVVKNASHFGILEPSASVKERQLLAVWSVFEGFIIIS